MQDILTLVLKSGARTFVIPYREVAGVQFDKDSMDVFVRSDSTKPIVYQFSRTKAELAVLQASYLNWIAGEYKFTSVWNPDGVVWK